MADEITEDSLVDILGPRKRQPEGDSLDDILGPRVPQQQGILEGMAYQALDAATLNAAKHFQSEGTLRGKDRFAADHPWLTTGAQAAGFIAPMLTPAGWVTRAAAVAPRATAAIARLLPFGNFSKAVAPGVGWKTMVNQSGIGALKAGAIMRFNDPLKPSDQSQDSDPGTAAMDNGYTRFIKAGDPRNLALDYGLGGAGGLVGAKVGSAVGGAAQKVLDLIPRFSYKGGPNGFYDWTRGGAQRAHEALTGDLVPGQGLEEAALHGMLGDFGVGHASRRAEFGYKYELAQRYMGAIDAGLSPSAARAQVASQVVADQGILQRYGLTGRSNPAPAASTIEDHVSKVASAIDQARQFPTTMQERVAMSHGGQTAKGTTTYGGAPNSYAALDEMLTSPGSKEAGSAKATATRWVQDRQQTQGERVQAFLDEKLGEGDVHKALEAHNARKAAAYDLYDPAIANWQANPKAPGELAQAVDQAIQDWRARPENIGMMTDAARATDAIIQDKLMSPVQLIQPTGELGLKHWRPPNDLQKFIAQRSNFMREAEKLKLSDPPTYRAMKQFQKEHLDPAVKPLAPEWAAANDLAGDTHALRRAFTAGETFPFGATSRQAEQLAMFKKMNPDQQAMFKAGLNAQIRKRLNTKTSTGDQHVLFSKRETGDVLRHVMGIDDGNEALRQLQAVAAASKTNKIFGQSVTHGRESEERANRSILNLIQSAGSAIAHPIHGLGKVMEFAGEKMATEAQRARNDRALRILTANTDDMSNYFAQLRDVTNAGQNHLPAVSQRIDDILRRVGHMTGTAGGRRKDDR